MPPLTLFRYIAVRTVFAVGGLLLIFTGLIMLVDLIENLRFAGKVDDGDFGLAAMLTIMRAPALAQTLIPFVFLFGAIWMFNDLNRRSEISVMRSAGLSIWRLLGPAAIIAALSGVLIITVIDPMSAKLFSTAENLIANKQGGGQNVIRVFTDGIWLRQRDEKMQLIINAQNFDEDRETLEDVTVWRTDLNSRFLERIDASEAVLSGQVMELRDARLKEAEGLTERRTPVYAMETVLTSADLRSRVPPPETMSIWQLPKFIALAETAGLPTVRYHMRFHDLSSAPLKLLAMVLIAASFSLRPARLGGVFGMVLASIGVGFLLYILSEISSALGQAGLVPIAMAAWTPAIIASLAAITALLHLEDG
ncbi:MAG: LPS export ABC transporter permease LptG [Marinicaulis sp.]|nr:LPS export ABC transporter permease LptG [Marinicaulis sp.]NNL88806.1 LPS export ABC transporter permease LptG [Marinicaulis sp.]